MKKTIAIKQIRKQLEEGDYNIDKMSNDQLEDVFVDTLTNKGINLKDKDYDFIEKNTKELIAEHA